MTVQAFKHIFWLDSLGNAGLKDYALQEFLNELWDRIRSPRTRRQIFDKYNYVVCMAQKQKEGWECGLWVCEFAMIFSQEVNLSSVPRIPTLLKSRVYKQCASSGVQSLMKEK
jgi:Ulp1 family protease